MKNFILKTLYLLLGEKSANQLRVIIFHNIETDQEKKFKQLIEKLKKHWNIISPLEFKEILTNKKPSINSKNILITFDDGYKSQKKITEKYLDPLNIKALFFVVTDFINLTTKEEL